MTNRDYVWEVLDSLRSGREARLKEVECLEDVIGGILQLWMIRSASPAERMDPRYDEALETAGDELWEAISRLSVWDPEAAKMMREVVRELEGEERL